MFRQTALAWSIAASGAGICRGTAIDVVPLYSHPGALSEEAIGQALALVTHSNTRASTGLANQSRHFGVGSHYGSGHLVSYLHPYVAELAPKLLEELRMLAHKADIEAQWNAWQPSSGNEPLHIGLRCLEVIEYGLRGAGGSIGWHNDGHTLFTMSVLLSEPGDFDGGSVEFRRQGSSIVTGTRLRGDVFVWRGWEEHRVLPMRSGSKQVLVAEWWSGDNATSESTRPPDTESGFRSALILDPSSAVLHAGLADGLSNRGERSKAEKEYKIAIGLDPSNAGLHSRHGAFSAQWGKLDVAQKSFEAALGLAPAEVDRHIDLGIAAEQRGDPKAAERFYRSAIELAPQDSRASTNLAMVFQRVGNMTASERMLQNAIAANPRDVRARSNLGALLHLEIKDLPAAKEQLSAALSIDPADGFTHHNMGILHEARGELTTAEEEYSVAIALNPLSLESHSNLGALLVQRGAHASALERIRTSIGLLPVNPALHNMLGEILEKVKDPNGSKLAFMTAIKLAPFDAEYHNNLGVMLARHGDSRAEARFKKAIQLKPDHETAHRNLDLFLIEMNAISNDEDEEDSDEEDLDEEDLDDEDPDIEADDEYLNGVEELEFDDDEDFHKHVPEYVKPEDGSIHTTEL